MKRYFSLCLAALLVSVAALAAAAPGGRPSPVAVEVLLGGAKAHSDPQGLADRVLELVKGARSRIWMLAYSLSDEELVEALTEQAAAEGMDLRILVDRDRYSDLAGDEKDSHRVGRLEDLRKAGKLATLAPAGPEGEGRLHSKVLMIDDRIIIGGSKNWSLLRSYAKWNDVVILHDAKGAVVSEFLRAFAAMAAKAGFGPVSRFRPSKEPLPDDLAVGRALMLFAAPGTQGEAIRAQLHGLVSKARRRIKLAMFSLNDIDLLRAVSGRLRRGQVEVEIVIDRHQHANLARRTDGEAKALRDLISILEQAGHLRVSGAGPQLHHKLSIVDDTVITGSANWTKAAWRKNHEAVVMLMPERGDDEPAWLQSYLERHRVLWESAGE